MKITQLNERHFDGRLKPVPLVLINARLYGRRLAFCSYDIASRTITQDVSKHHVSLVADKLGVARDDPAPSITGGLGGGTSRAYLRPNAAGLTKTGLLICLRVRAARLFSSTTIVARGAAEHSR